MFIEKKLVWISGFLISAGLLCGCGSNKRLESSEVPGQDMSNEQAVASKAEMEASGHYLVQKHDCLWTIAGKPNIYDDSFEWPLLFKANRDEISDPDLIYPRQDLRVMKDFPLEERNHARQTAMMTPKYVPHSAPRSTLPVDYF